MMSLYQTVTRTIKTGTLKKRRESRWVWSVHKFDVAPKFEQFQAAILNTFVTFERIAHKKVQKN